MKGLCAKDKYDYILYIKALIRAYKTRKNIMKKDVKCLLDYRVFLRYKIIYKWVSLWGRKSGAILGHLLGVSCAIWFGTVGIFLAGEWLALIGVIMGAVWGMFCGVF